MTLCQTFVYVFQMLAKDIWPLVKISPPNKLKILADLCLWKFRPENNWPSQFLQVECARQANCGLWKGDAAKEQWAWAAQQALQRKSGQRWRDLHSGKRKGHRPSQCRGQRQGVQGRSCLFLEILLTSLATWTVRSDILPVATVGQSRDGLVKSPWSLSIKIGFWREEKIFVELNSRGYPILLGLLKITCVKNYYLHNNSYKELFVVCAESVKLLCLNKKYCSKK